MELADGGLFFGPDIRDEYPDNDETIAPEALVKIADWIAARK
ncbi:MAG: hypothetical protein ABIT83_06355 [Massilia sp.]